MGGRRGHRMGAGILNLGLDRRVRLEGEIREHQSENQQLKDRIHELEFAFKIIAKVPDLPITVINAIGVVIPDLTKKEI